jgi:hypothetical protein
MTCENVRKGGGRPFHHTPIRVSEKTKSLRVSWAHGNPRTCFGLGVSTDVPIRKEGVLFIKVGDLL